MKNCIRCGQKMEDTSVFCLACGTDQRFDRPERTQAAFLKVLCVLTITGSVIAIASTIFNVIANSYFEGYDKTLPLLTGLTCVGTLTGAIFMLRRNMAGLYIYTVSQSLYIILLLMPVFSFWGSNARLSTTLIYSVLPSSAFIVMYWLRVNRQALVSDKRKNMYKV